MAEKPMIEYRKSGSIPQFWNKLEIYGDGRMVYRSRGREPVESYATMPHLEVISRMFDENNFFSMLGFYYPIQLPDGAVEYELAFNYQDKKNRVTVVTSENLSKFWAKVAASELVTTSGSPPESFWNIKDEMEKIIKDLPKQ